MAKDVLHVVPNGDGWAVKREGNERMSSTHDTQKNAIEGARELAKMGDDIVIHRPDGSIRDRITYSGGAINSDERENNGSGSRDNRPQEHDLWPVGSRVSWSAVLGGVVVALAVIALLTALTTALGISTADRLSGKSIAILSGYVWLLILVLSLFFGGLVAARLTTRETKTEAVILGVLVWGTAASLAAIGVGAGMSMAFDAARTSQVVSTDQSRRFDNTNNPDRVRDDQGASDEQARQKSREAEQTVRNASPQQVAWWTFAGLAVSILASIVGALAGAGPEVRRQNLWRTPAAQRVNEQPSSAEKVTV